MAGTLPPANERGNVLYPFISLKSYSPHFGITIHGPGIWLHSRLYIKIVDHACASTSMPADTIHLNILNKITYPQIHIFKFCYIQFAHNKMWYTGPDVGDQTSPSLSSYMRFSQGHAISDYLIHFWSLPRTWLRGTSLKFPGISA